MACSKEGQGWKVYLLGNWEPLGPVAHVFHTLIWQPPICAWRVMVLESSGSAHSDT